MTDLLPIILTIVASVLHLVVAFLELLAKR